MEIVARDEGDFRKAPTFHDAEVQALPAIGSYHNPLLLVLHPVRTTGKGRSLNRGE